MVRAGVFIGVDRTGQLQVLRDAAAGAARMHQWALSQGLVDQTSARLITDAGGARVHPDLVYDAIKTLTDGAGVDQLLLYFAGHGVNINRSEQWLLTDAPGRTSAAVNVSGSVELARYCGIRHVVIISDACRVAAEGVQAQNVRGIDVFPNDAASDRARPVDQFFACVLGRTAAEIKDPAAAAGNYSALYTTALLEALSGKVPSVLEPSTTAGDGFCYVRPRGLESHLEMEVPRRVAALGLAAKVNQNPDAIITSDGAWLSQLPVPPAPVDPPINRPAPAARPAPEPPPPTTPTTLRDVSREMMRSVAAGTLGSTDWQALSAPVRDGAALVETVARVSTPFGPDHFETHCGIKVRGARIIAFESPNAPAELLGSGGDILRVSPPNNVPAASVLLQFDRGAGTVIPALSGFVAALTFDDGELVDVAYEPSANDWRWALYNDRADTVRALRAVAASSSRHGRFSLDGADAVSLAQEMQYAKSVDPTLSIYAAYAYHDRQEIDRIRHMAEYLRADIGVTFFDLALLGRGLGDQRFTNRPPIVPFFPLLSQGWALLGANRVVLHPALDNIEHTMRDSLWTLFDGAGLEKAARALRSGDLL